MKRIVARWLAPQVEAGLRAVPVVVVTGARQTGKTTLVQAVAPRRRYLTLDDYEILDQAQQSPDSLAQDWPVTIDEVQRAPDLLLAIKRAVDRRREAGAFILTGSANLLLSDRVSESLAGRAVYLELPPFCPGEWLGQAQRALAGIGRLFDPALEPAEWGDEAQDWPGWLLRGGFAPALAQDEPQARSFWYRGYVQTFVERDLRSLSAVSNLPDFQRLMVLSANQCARLINQADLARDAALSHATAHRYLNLLETACLVTRVAPHTPGPLGAQVKSPRWFWTDCGLAAWLAGIRSPEALAARTDRGFWLEQTLFQSLQAWRAADPDRRTVGFWRDRNGREVDFVLEQDGVMVALEVKEARRAALDDARGIEAFRQALGRRGQQVRGVVLHAGPSRRLGDNLFALSFGWLTPRHDGLT